jgi:hypothetical protein
MRAINHALTGAVIGLSVSDPVIAMPVAFLSHFALDGLPHFGERKKDHGSKNFRDLLILDALLCFGLVLLLAIWQPKHWLLAGSCAFLATSPDFMWVGKYLRARAGRKEHVAKNVVIRFHGKIQWFERPIGLFVELAWAPAMVLLLVDLTR